MTVPLAIKRSSVNNKAVGRTRCFREKYNGIKNAGSKASAFTPGGETK